MPKPPTTLPPGASAQRGVAAVETAAALLDVLQRARGPLGVSAIAAASGLAPSRVHHYLVSLQKTGLVRRDGVPSRYGLGPFAIRLGLAAVDRLEVQHFCAPFLHRLSVATQEASFFSVWSEPGPMIVRWEQGLRPLTVFARLGTVMPLLRSATGDVYCAWAPPADTAAAVEKALRAHPPSKRRDERAALAERTTTAQADGCAATLGAMLPDVGAVAAPVFGRDGELAGAVTVLGLLRGFDASPDGPVAAQVRQAGAELSRRLGFGD